MKVSQLPVVVFAADGLFNLNTTATPFAVGGETTDWGIQSFTGLGNYVFPVRNFYS